MSMLSLKQSCGLEISLDTDNFKLSFGAELTAPEGVARTIEEMREVLMDPSVDSPHGLYFMYRDVHLLKDSGLLKQYNLRYDVTVIKPDLLGRELMKTAGHYHPGSFGELYEVVSGRAFCMLQKHAAQDYKIIEDVIFVEAAVGQKIVIPSGYGHILINPGPGALVTSNWVSSRFASEYDLYKKAKGAAYYLTLGSNKKIEFSQNSSFKELPALRSAQPARKIEKFGLKTNSPIYDIIHTAPQALDFLNNPEKYGYSDVFIYGHTGKEKFKFTL